MTNVEQNFQVAYDSIKEMEATAKEMKLTEAFAAYRQSAAWLFAAASASGIFLTTGKETSKSESHHETDFDAVPHQVSYREEAHIFLQENPAL